MGIGLDTFIFRTDLVPDDFIEIGLSTGLPDVFTCVIADLDSFVDRDIGILPQYGVRAYGDKYIICRRREYVDTFPERSEPIFSISSDDR